MSPYYEYAVKNEERASGKRERIGKKKKERMKGAEIGLRSKVS
jgi:hypothetical protein